MAGEWSRTWTKLGDLYVLPVRTDERPEVWVSHDLLHWTRVRLSFAPGELLDVTAVTIGGPGLVAIGDGFLIDAPIEASWTSTDGLTWKRVLDAGLPPGQKWLLDATARGHVTYVAGPVDVTRFPGSKLDLQVDQLSMVVSEGGLTAFVSPTGKGHSVQMWQATGTTAWRRVALLPQSKEAILSMATHGPQGWFLLGCRYECNDGFGWTSADGSTWQTVTKSTAITVNALIADESGFIAVGDSPTGTGCALGQDEILGGTLTSTDGRRWRQLPDEAQFDRASIYVLILKDRTLFGLGLRYTATSVRSTVWTTSLPANTLTGGPPPAPAPPSAPGGCGP